MTEIQFRMPSVLALDPCEKCGTPLALVEYQVFDMPADQDADPVPRPAQNESGWCEYTLWTHPETGQQIRRLFRPHTPERCTKARNPGSEPCESCGTPITRRDPQPPDADQYEGLPKQAGVWD